MTRRFHAILLCFALCFGCDNAQDVVRALDVSDGASCATDLTCFGQTCLSDEQGFPNGYCTTLKCDQVGCSGLFAECFRTRIEGTDVAACFDLCRHDGTCSRASEGYECVTLNDTPVCLPPGATSAPAQGATGSSCSADTQCNGEGATCLQSFFGGYCVTLACQGSAQCPVGAPCVPLNPDGATDEDKSFACMKGCIEDGDCRFGYSCQEYEGAMICLERPDAQPRNPDGADDGAPCLSNINCKGGTCIKEATGADDQPSHPGGYCSTKDCSSDEDCNGDAVCTGGQQRVTSCRASCTTDANCRDGYTCRTNEDGQTYCETVIAPVVIDDRVRNQMLEIECGPSKDITFEVPEDALGFLVTPFNTKRRPIRLDTLSEPGGNTLDIGDDYDFMITNEVILGQLTPILFPGSDRPEFIDRFGGGEYTLSVTTSADEVCYYVLPQMAEGTRLDLNLYFVGVPGVSATGTLQDPDVAEVIAEMQRIYQQMGISVRVARAFDASPEVTETYRIIRDFFDTFRLVATSEPPGETLDEVLSVNIFLIEDFNVPDARGLLGVSAGLPGAAGLHGTNGSGLVFSTVGLGTDNATLGQTLAHEVGHFLGLRHTTEHLGRDHDPITDTPECLSPDLGYLCQDARNFMFAFSLGGGEQTQATPGQAYVIRRNPLVKP